MENAVLIILALLVVSGSVLADDDGFEEEGGFHVVLMSLAALFGIVTVATGMHNSRIKSLRSLIPVGIPRRLHRYSAVTYYSLFIGTFLLWTNSFYATQGRLFFTLHGQMGLMAVLFAMVGIATGLVKLWKPLVLWRVHITSNVIAILLLFATIILGLGLGD